MKILIFSECEQTCATFALLGFRVGSLHAGKSQKERISVLKDFRRRRLEALFCTDVGNRGLDIPYVTYVINYDLPDTTAAYVHRVGRTARAGRVGTSISLVSQYEVERVKAIEKDTGVRMELYDKINEEEAESRMYAIAEKRVQAKIV